jgi:hypothetical protein
MSTEWPEGWEEAKPDGLGTDRRYGPNGYSATVRQMVGITYGGCIEQTVSGYRYVFVTLSYMKSRRFVEDTLVAVARELEDGR